MGGLDGSADRATAQVADSCRCLRCAPWIARECEPRQVRYGRAPARETLHVAIAVGGDECAARGHALFDLQQALVCEECSKVAAETARRGIDPESAVEDFRRRPAN